MLKALLARIAAFFKRKADDVHLHVHLDATELRAEIDSALKALSLDEKALVAKIRSVVKAEVAKALPKKAARSK